MRKTSNKEKGAEKQAAEGVVTPKEAEGTVAQEETEKAAEGVETREETGREVPENIEQLMRLYAQYEEIYVTKDGFVHPGGSPQYLVADATLYKNKYYNNK